MSRKTLLRTKKLLDHPTIPHWLLQKHFLLEVEGMGDALHHSRHLQEWYSKYQEDQVFGAKHDFFQQDLSGKNTYINPPFNTFEDKQNLIEKVITKIAESLRSNLPTRVVLLIPIFEGNIGKLYENQAQSKRFLEIATFPQGSFSFVAPEHYRIHDNFQPGYFAQKIGLYLCANKASLQVDPINWESFTRDLTLWSQSNTKLPPIINTITSKKFEQRVLPSHSGRSFNTQGNWTFRSSNNFFHYYDYTFAPEDETHTIKTFVRNPRDLKLLACINQHDRLAGALGILPNHLIQLLRLSNPENLTKVTDDLRFTTFWSTYSIWTKHQTLSRAYWKSIPECCKSEIKKKKSEKKTVAPVQKRKRKRKNKKLALEDCQNPFHYLVLKKNLQPIHGTCNCSAQLDHRLKKNIALDNKTVLDSRQPSLSPFLNNISKTRLDNKSKEIIDDTSGLDYKHTPANKTTQLVITQFLHTKTSGDISRDQQDRKKLFKQQTLPDLFK